MAANQKINFMTLVSYSFLQFVLANTYYFATIQNVTDDRQTDREWLGEREGLMDGDGLGREGFKRENGLGKEMGWWREKNYVRHRSRIEVRPTALPPYHAHTHGFRR